MSFWLPVAAIISAVAALLNVAGASLYDIKQMQQRRQQKLHPHSRSSRRRPLVSVIVTSYNCQDSLTDCLSSLLGSNYLKLEVILADNASTDGSKRLVRQLITAHPKKKLTLYARRSHGNTEQLLAGAFKKASGEIVMVLDAAQAVHKSTISQAVKRLNADPELSHITANYKLPHAYKLAALLQEFSLLLQVRVKKAASFYQTLSIRQGSGLYTREAFSKYLKRSGTQLKTGFGDDVVVYGQPHSFPQLVKQTYTDQLGRLRSWPAQAANTTLNLRYLIGLLRTATTGLALLAAPLMLAYFAYLSLKLHQPTFLVISGIAASLFLLFAILEDEQLSLSAKLGYIILMPVSYGWFCLVSSIQCLAFLTGFRLRLKIKPSTAA